MASCPSDSKLQIDVRKLVELNGMQRTSGALPRSLGALELDRSSARVQRLSPSVTPALSSTHPSAVPQEEEAGEVDQTFDDSSSGHSLWQHMETCRRLGRELHR